jgi:hypothetical protein
MTVNLSMLAGAGAQFFDNSGVILSGGLVYTYAAGTTTPQAAYTSSSGSTAHSNPIVLDSAGRVSSGGEIWLTDAVSYKFVLKTSTGTTIGTYDNVTGNASGIYAAFAASSGSSLVGFIQTGTGAVATTVQTRLRKTFFTSDYDTFANAVTAAINGTLIVNTTISISSNTTVPSTVVLRVPNEGIFNIATGITLTINGCFEAGVYQVFNCTGTGAVVINAQFTGVGYPEWWGAVSDNTGASAANRTAINAAIVALQTTTLQPAAYYFENGPIEILTQGKRLIGAGANFDGVTDGKATRLVAATASIDALQVGPYTDPGGINLFPQGIVVQDINVVRSVAPNIGSLCTGVSVSYTLRAYLSNVKSESHMIGFQFDGTVALIAERCNSNRAQAGSGGGTDLWYGYYVNGFSGIAAGGNASIYLNYCAAGCDVASLQTSSSLSYGFYLNNKFTDAFLESPETVNCAIGINIQGDSDGSAISFGNTDLQIKNPINDQTKLACIVIQGVNKSGSVEVTDGYGGPTAGSTAAIVVDSSYGVTLRGGQYVMQNHPSVVGISSTGATGLVVDRVIFLECKSTGVALATCVGSDIRPILKNNFTVGSAAVQVSGTSTANYLQPAVSGSATGFSLGIQVVGTADARNEYNCSLLDSSAISGGSNNKLLRNGVQITATGLSGTNLVSGVMT